MADKVVTVVSTTHYYETTMDETLVATYISDAQTAGIFTSDDGDLVIPWNETTAITIEDPT